MLNPFGLRKPLAKMRCIFYTGDSLPQKYRCGASVVEHGSWNRDRFNGYKVNFVPFSGGRPSGKGEDVVTGFLTGNGEARGRPAGVAIDRTALFRLPKTAITCRAYFGRGS